MKIAVIGTGYVGLVTGACLARAGYRVTCSDIDVSKIAMLDRSELPIFEPGLQEIISNATARHLLKFSSDTCAVAAAADMLFLAVGTPSREDGDADLSALYGAVQTIAGSLKPGITIVVKSTVPVGTGDRIERLVRTMRPTLQFAVVSNPEFLRAGSAVNDFMYPDRVVLGTDEPRAAAVLTRLYRDLDVSEDRILIFNRRTAELIKYAANALLATRVAFINEIADLCEKLDARVGDVARGIGSDHRLGPHFLEAGPGFGGSCFPKDARALVRMGERSGAQLSIVKSVIASNEARKAGLADRIAAAVGDLRGKVIALLGLTFKAGTDDLRDSPSIVIAEQLVARGATVRVYDPVGLSRAAAILPQDVVRCRSLQAAATDAHAVVIATAWDEFKSMDLRALRRRMTVPLIIDLRNMLSAEDVKIGGFQFVAIGNGGASRQAAVMHGRTVGSRARRVQDAGRDAPLAVGALPAE